MSVSKWIGGRSGRKWSSKEEIVFSLTLTKSENCEKVNVSSHNLIVLWVNTPGYMRFWNEEENKTTSWKEEDTSFIIAYVFF